MKRKILTIAQQLEVVVLAKEEYINGFFRYNEQYIGMCLPFVFALEKLHNIKIANPCDCEHYLPFLLMIKC